MSPWHDLQLGIDSLAPHFVAMSLIAARLLPVAFLCPLFGGSNAPTHVKLGIVLALATFLHVAAGVTFHAGVPNAAMFGVLAVKESVLGLALGLIASLPFDVVRMSGRFIDTFRGSSAEASLPLVGSKEAASGDLLYNLALALAATGVAMPLWLAALCRSFVVLEIGAFTAHESVALHIATLVGVAFSSGLAIGAPVAAGALCIDALVGLASRANPSMSLQDLGAPLRILGGGIVLWLTVGLIAQQFLAVASGTTDAIQLVMELGRG